MAFNMDTRAIANFRQVSFGNENTILTLGDDGDKTVKAKGLWGKFNALGRSAAEKDANNAMRTELLQSLGKALGLAGMGTTKDGKTTFSKEFMDQLDHLLGKNFKRDDFGIGRDGTVASGKPLTERRLHAIIDTVVLKAGVEFNTADYRTKLDAIKAAMPKSKHVQECFADVDHALTFLENEIDSFIEVNELYDADSSFDDDNMPFYVRDQRPVKEGEAPHGLRMQIKKMDDFASYVQARTGLVFHMEELPKKPGKLEPTDGFNYDDNKCRSLADIKGYFKQLLEAYVKLAIDTFIDCKHEGKMTEYLQSANNGVCIDARIDNYQNFRGKYLHVQGPSDVNVMETATVIADHDINTGLVVCLAKEIGAIDQRNAKLPPAQQKTYDNTRDYWPELKAALVGKTRPVPEENGKVSVRVVTDADVERLADTAMNAILGL